jgi:hypothetical protein
MDPDGTSIAENGTAFTGLTFDSSVMAVTSVDMTDNVGSSSYINNDTYSGGGSGDYLTFDVGGGSIETGLDQNIGVNATITLGDGSTVSRTLSILQTESGHTFIAEWTSTSQLDGLNIQSIEIDSVWQVSWGGASTTHSISGASIVCFRPGTLIRTPNGVRPVETLHSGDVVDTIDSGPQSILRTIRHSDEPSAQTFPVVFEPGSLGMGMPVRTLILSPQHRVLCRSKLVERMFGVEEVLIAAKHLVGLPGITRQDGFDGLIDYHHLELARHNILIANGSAAESCLRGEQALQAYPRLARDALLESSQEHPCRHVPSPKQQKKFARRARINGVVLFCGSLDAAPVRHASVSEAV